MFQYPDTEKRERGSSLHSKIACFETFKITDLERKLCIFIWVQNLSWSDVFGMFSVYSTTILNHLYDI